MGPYPAEAASGFHLHSAKMKRKSAVCLHSFIFAYLYIFLDHDEERFTRAVVVDRNGVSFNVVYDDEDQKYFWLMLPIQLSPILGLKQNLNQSDPFPREKEFSVSNDCKKLDDSGVDDIIRCVYYFFFFNYFFFTNFFSCSRTVPMAQPVYPLNSKTPKKSSPKDKSGHVRVSDAAMSKLK